MSTLTVERTELHHSGAAKLVHLIDHERSRHGEVRALCGKRLKGVSASGDKCVVCRDLARRYWAGR
jgi:hypothetical protein